MSWNRNSLRIAACAILAGTFTATFTATGAMASTIVVRANGPSAGSYPPGRMLAAGGSITLQAGDTITVLDSGGTRVLRGPGRVAVSGNGAASVNGIAALIADTGVRQTRTGATRGTNFAPPHPTNLWYVDVARGGNFCVGDARALGLWRADSTDPLELSIGAPGGTPVTVAMRAGQAVAAWPAALPVRDGASYRIADGAGARVEITLHMLAGGTPQSLDNAAEGLISHGCDAQVETIVAATNAEPGA
ncbi:MAG: hypothetical protein KGK11_01050 [Sphingomonadales bacterium]|nr:hypothetical protein [Sphingomonadales bacterium]